MSRKRHTATDVLRFFKLIDLHVAKELEIHVVLDNLSAHKAPEVQQWLSHPKRARWHLSLHPYQLELVEPGGAVVQGADRSTPASGRFYQR